MWRNIASNFLTLMIVALVVGLGGLAWAQREYSADGPLEAAICLRVAPGSNMTRVAAQLEEQGAISNGMIYRLGAEYSDKSGQLKAGNFLIEEGTSMAEIVDMVTTSGPPTCGTEVIYRISVANQSIQVRELDPATQEFEVTGRFDPTAEDAPESYANAVADTSTRYRVVVAEGVTSWQITEGLKAWDILEGEIASVPPEGSLAPEGYEVRAGEARADILAEMTELQASRLAEAWAARQDGLQVDTPEEAMILASIIEKETQIPEERPLVASVLQNRLERGWQLQFDPTIIYGITRGIGTLDRPISNADISGRTEARIHGSIEYNTYQIDGLPAGPIGNPGVAAIEAALSPSETDYMFFVATGDGGHAFAETLDEHNENVARLRAREAEARDN